MSKSSVVKKLRIQPGQRILVLNPPPGYVDELGDLPEGVELADKPEGTFDFVYLFVKDSSEWENLGPTAVDAIKHDGLFWISYPKRSSKVETDLTRDVLWELVAETGLRPVSQVSIDDVWSAMRLRPADKLGK